MKELKAMCELGRSFRTRDVFRFVYGRWPKVSETYKAMPFVREWLGKCYVVKIRHGHYELTDSGRMLTAATNVTNCHGL